MHVKSTMIAVLLSMLGTAFHTQASNSEKEVDKITENIEKLDVISEQIRNDKKEEECPLNFLTQKHSNLVKESEKPFEFTKIEKEDLEKFNNKDQACKCICSGV